jgi:hypothetical protein
LNSGDRLWQARAAFVCMKLANSIWDGAGTDRSTLDERFGSLRDALGNLLSPEDPRLALAGAWALAWVGAARLPDSPPEPRVILSLFRLWQEANSVEFRRIAALAFSTQPLLARDIFSADRWGDCQDLFAAERAYSYDWPAILVLRWYLGSPWSDSQLAKHLSYLRASNNTPRRGCFSADFQPRKGVKFHALRELDAFRPTARELLVTLGEDGRRVLENWDTRAESRQPTFEDLVQQFTSDRP